jgi:predicted nucleic acid-binding protein
MFIPPPLRVVLDANVLFPFTLRDTVLRAASSGLFALSWSAEILDEMERALGRITADKALGLRKQMERFFDDAMVTGYAAHIPQLHNDPGDRHVVAVAIEAGAELIVTQNLKHFRVLPEGLEAVSPDQFLCGPLGRAPGKIMALLHAQASDLVTPPLAVAELLDGLSIIVPRFAARAVECLKGRAGGCSTLSFACMTHYDPGPRIAPAMAVVVEALGRSGSGPNPPGTST